MKLLAMLWCCYLCPLVSTHEPSAVCTTPNGETASCILLFKCPVLITAAVSNDETATKFVQKSACGKKKFMVCCGSSGNYADNDTTTKLPYTSTENATIAREAKRQLLPSKVYCGLQHTDDYFYNKTETSVDEFPWMVYLANNIYLRDSNFRLKTNCVGVLINNRYVLTHKECKPIYVTMGQHHIYRDRSCINTQYGIDDCTDHRLSEFVQHSITSATNNFALVRLERTVPYSGFVRPICLPAEEDEKPTAGAIILTSGWGEEDDTPGKNVMIKKRIKHTIMKQEECENGNPVSNPICGERFSNSSSYVCPGDKGGPLMYRYTATRNLNWVALGVIVGTSACAKRQPVVAERITPEVVDWILDTIKP